MLSATQAADEVLRRQEHQYEQLVHVFNFSLTNAVDMKRTFFRVPLYTATTKENQERFKDDLKAHGFQYFTNPSFMSEEDMVKLQSDDSTGYWLIKTYLTKGLESPELVVKIPSTK